MSARLVAQILREEGVGTGRFVEAGREQLIGKYMGHTSPLVARLFRQARGGVLFIDEVGALLDSRSQDIYATEAVNALVRHMELEPQTVVILATYPDEMKELLASNPGLSSRIAKIVPFEGYDDDRLWDILGWIASQESYTLPQEARPDCVRFFRTLREKKKDTFGNGREARRLFQTAVDEAALRIPKSDKAALPVSENQSTLDTLTLEDFRLAVAVLLAAEEAGGPIHSIGFRYEW